MINNCNNWFYLCLALLGVILAMLAMFFGYSLKLDQRTVKLEKKNGKEQRQINELREEIRQLKSAKDIRGFYSKSILKEKDNQNHDHDKNW